MHSCLPRFCKNSVGTSLFRFLRCSISRSASSSSSDWSAASCLCQDKLLSMRVPCLRGSSKQGVSCAVSRHVVWPRCTRLDDPLGSMGSASRGVSDLVRRGWAGRACLHTGRGLHASQFLFGSTILTFSALRTLDFPVC